MSWQVIISTFVLRRLDKLPVLATNLLPCNTGDAPKLVTAILDRAKNSLLFILTPYKKLREILIPIILIRRIALLNFMLWNDRCQVKGLGVLCFMSKARKVGYVSTNADSPYPDLSGSYM